MESLVLSFKKIKSYKIKRAIKKDLTYIEKISGDSYKSYIVSTLSPKYA